MPWREGQHLQRHRGTRQKSALEERQRRAGWLERPAEASVRRLLWEEHGTKAFDGAHKSQKIGSHRDISLHHRTEQRLCMHSIISSS